MHSHEKNYSSVVLICIFLPPKVRSTCMLAHPNNPYKYYLPKVHVIIYPDVVCLFKLAFMLVGRN